MRIKKKILPLLSLTVLTTAMATTASGYEVTDQIIVQFDNPYTDGKQRASGLSKQLGKKLDFVRITSSGAYVYKLPSREALPNIHGYVTAISAVTGVKKAEADQILKRGALPNPPADGTFTIGTAYDLQWHYHSAAGGMNAVGAWNQFNVSEGPVTVAVLDTGIATHSDIANGTVNNLVPGFDTITDVYTANDGDGPDSDPSDPGDWLEVAECGNSEFEASSWHGTHVTGTIAAITNNGQGVASVGYNLLKVMPVRVLGKCGGYLSDIADGIYWAADPANPNQAKVINMSLGGGGSCSFTFQNAIDQAVAWGSTVVVAAGNSGLNASNYQPASCDKVVTVAAVNPDGGRAYYSNYGNAVDLAAPGGDASYGSTGMVLSTLNSGQRTPEAEGYAFYQGTSMASPHVAAVAGLLYVKNPAITPAEVESILTSTAKTFPASCSQCGAGILDAGAAVAAVDTTPQPQAPEAPSSAVATGGEGQISLSWNDNSDNEDSFTIQRSKKLKGKRWEAYAPVGSVGADVTSFDDSSLESGTYRYRVNASNSVGTSAWSVSNSAEATTADSGDGGGGGNGNDGSCKGGPKRCP
ncbi:MAG: S8 family serine peptidase [Neptuniibacter sp.]